MLAWLRRHDLPGMLAAAAALLRLLTLDVDSRHTARIPLANYLLSAVTVCLYVYTYHVSVYWFLLARAGPLLLKVQLLSLSVSSSIGVVKLLYMYFNSKKLKQLVSEYLECDASVAAGSRTGRRVRATLHGVKRRAVVFWLLIIANGVVYVAQPLLTPGRHLTVDDQLLLGLEPMFESPNYEMAFIAELFGVFLTVYAPANFTAFIIVLAGYSEAQVLALAHELRRLWPDAREHCRLARREAPTNINNASDSPNRSDSQNQYQVSVAMGSDIDHADFSITADNTQEEIILNEFIRCRLISIIKMHAININLIKQLESIFQSAMAIEFTLLSCGLIAELLGGLENTYIQVPFALIQVGMDCITGQKLIDASTAFQEAVYGCGWERFDRRGRRLVLVVLQSAQRTLQLSAGGVARLSYAALMSVVRAVYSAYTALRTTMN